MNKMMKATELQKLLTNMLILIEKQNEWIDKLPREISAAFFDNPYADSSSAQISQLLKFIFGNWFVDISYFLYESYPHRITSPKGDYVINDLEEYIDYLVAEGFIEDDRAE